MCQPEVPTLRRKRPELRVTENQEKNTGNKKAERPKVACCKPTLANAYIGQKEETGYQDEHAGQMVVELAFPFIGQKFCWCSIVRRHRHPRVHVMRRVILRANRWQSQKQ